MCVWSLSFFFFKQKTAYEMRISDWSSDVCSSDLHIHDAATREAEIDAALEIVAVRVSELRRELALPADNTLMHPGHGLAQFAHRIIGILQMHHERRVCDHALRRTIGLVPSRIPQRHIAVQRIKHQAPQAEHHKTP